MKRPQNDGIYILLAEDAFQEVILSKFNPGHLTPKTFVENEWASELETNAKFRNALNKFKLGSHDCTGIKGQDVLDVLKYFYDFETY